MPSAIRTIVFDAGGTQFLDFRTGGIGDLDDRLSRLIAQVSVLAARYRQQIAEIEINPVLVHPLGEGVTIVDALVVRKG